MNSEIYRELMKEYDIKRQIAIDRAKEKLQKIYDENPKLKELKDEQNAIAISTARLMLNADELTKQIELEKLEFKTNQIESKIEKILNQIGYSKEDLEPKYECNICKDTGIDNANSDSKICNCFKQKLINTAYKQSSMNNLEYENFDTFDIGYYSSKCDEKKYGIDKSPLDNIKSIKKVSEDFCKNIDSRNQKNLLFTGDTGLGKTFLANSIANRLIKNGKTVVYQTAPMLLDMVMEYKYSSEKNAFSNEQYMRIFDVDLLIIDDLGTEMKSDNKFTELFNIINTRSLNNKKILISTNLTLQDIYGIYDKRIISRLIGNFVICKFIGEDIRIMKKRIN